MQPVLQQLRHIALHAGPHLADTLQHAGRVTQAVSATQIVQMPLHLRQTECHGPGKRRVMQQEFHHIGRHEPSLTDPAERVIARNRPQ